MAVVNNEYKYVPEWQKAQANGAAAYAQSTPVYQQQQEQKSVTTQAAKKKKATTVPIGAAQSYDYGVNPGAYSNRYAAAMDDILSQIRNRKKFKYEFNSDALFNAYKDLYTENGKQASLDAMGQAAALTGGYGSSYGQQVGQQTYQQYLRNLYDVGLDLRDRAYQMNQDEIADLYNQYGLMAEQEALDYARYQDAMSNYLANASMSSGGGRKGSGGTVYAYAGKFYKNENGKMMPVSEEEVRNRGYKINTSYQDGYNVLTGYGTANVKNAKVGNITHGVDPNAYKKAKVGVTWKMPGK